MLVKIKVGVLRLQEFNLDTAQSQTKQEKITYVTEQTADFQEKRGYDFVKRLFDFMAALVLIVILALPMLILMLIICVDSPGDPIFRQVRLGKAEKPFVLYKFRSMRQDAETDGPKLAEENDPRVTRIGRFMRETRIDELPQLVNILRGEMSFVGPRPERPEFYRIFDTYIPGFRRRMQVLPGLTGWAQVNGGYEIAPQDKLAFDIYYIRHRSSWLDVKCLFKTVHVVFKRKGR